MKTLISGALLGATLALAACGSDEETGPADDPGITTNAASADVGAMAADPASGPATEASPASEAGLAQPGETSAAEPPGSPGQDEAMGDAVVGGAAGDGGPPGP